MPLAPRRAILALFGAGNRSRPTTVFQLRLGWPSGPEMVKVRAALQVRPARGESKELANEASRVRNDPIQPYRAPAQIRKEIP